MPRGSKTKLQESVEELKSYFGVLSKDDMFSILMGAQSAADIKQIYFDTIAGKPLPESGAATIVGLLQSQDYAFFAHEIIDKINEFCASPPPGALDDLKKTVFVVYEDSEADLTIGTDIGTKTSLKELTEPFKAGPKDKPLMPVNMDKKNPSKSKPALSAFVVGPNALNPSKRGTPSAEIFLNAIPTMEMSRCVPFLDVTLVPSAPAISDSGKVQTISMLQFLRGNFEPVKDTADDTIARGVDLKVRKNILNTPPPKVFDESKKREDPSTTSAGMEIFTSPQTLVNGDESYGDGGVPSHRGAAVIDRFRPLMSLQNFKVDLAPSAGLLTFKTATMSLILHDRSRLSEVAEFVKPDLYGKTNMIITYGWSHPDGNVDTNVYGKFLDSLKCTEKYGIINSSFSFDDVGQVAINLKLSLKGSSQVELSKITEGTAVANALKDVKDLTESIKAIRTKRKGGKKKGKSISGSKILSSMSDTRSAMGFDGDVKKEINEYIANVRKAGSPGDLKKILPLLKKLRTAVPAARKKMASIVDAKVKGQITKRKLTAKKKKDPKKDPFAQTFEGKKKYVNIKEDDPKYTTFGSLILAFAGAPLCGTGQFDEVQFVFYSFNDKASYMKNAPISSFPIKFDNFVTKFKEACKTTTNMPIGAFIKFLTKNFVSSQTAEAYGLTSLYEQDKENPGKLKLKEKFEDEKIGKDLLRAEKDLRLMDAYKITDKEKDFGFKVPRIQMQAECLPAKEDGQSIYRIHIFDQNATSYSTLSQILKSAQEDALAPFLGDVTKTAMKKGKDKSGNKEAMLAHLKSAIQSGILEAIPSTAKLTLADIKSGDTRFRVKTDFQKVKSYLSSTMPSLIYGSSATNITSANLASMNNPALANINMRRSGLGSGTTALGLRESGLPLQIAPMSLSMTSFGFPIASIGQTFFIDFGTGTSADNIYCCSKVSHEISAGTFNTSWTFQPLNAYGTYTNIGNSVNQAIAEIESD